MSNTKTNDTDRNVESKRLDAPEESVFAVPALPDAGFAFQDEEDPLGLTGPVTDTEVVTQTEVTAESEPPAEPGTDAETGFAFQDDPPAANPALPPIIRGDDESGMSWKQFLFAPRKVFQNRTLQRKIGTPRTEDLGYDPAFYRAVSEGHLPPEEARFRGTLDGFADMIARAHDLPLLLARRVAENRVTLDQARQMLEEHQLLQLDPEELERRIREAERRNNPSHAASLFWPMATSLMVTGLISFGLYSAMPVVNAVTNTSDEIQPVGEAPSSRVAQSTKRNPEGALTLVVADSPQAVLEVVASSEPDLVAIAVGRPDPTNEGRWLGIVQDRSAAGWPRKGMEIVGNADRWEAGNGAQPISLDTRVDESQLEGLIRINDVSRAP